VNERDDEQQGESVDLDGVAADAAEEAGAADAAEEAGAADATPFEGGAAVELDLQDLSRGELENELELARAEIERLQEQSLRRQAELINFRRRAQKELADAATAGQGRLLEGLVPVIDDFERAVEAESADARAYHEGMQLILRSLQKALEQIGLERIAPSGEAFDPNYHEAIARHETDEVPNGHVLDVYQAGYKLRDRLIRPAAVVVAFGGGAGEGAPADEPQADDGDVAAPEAGDRSDA
jgi:molecular chaperone GrpE